jgi:DNA-binding response OmpR family regulator
MSASLSEALGSGAIRPEQPLRSLLRAEPVFKDQTLLVVDDEPTLREVEALFLRNSGYQVLEAGCVVKALQMAAATTPIHLLLTDHSLPDGNGVDLARRFRLLHPQAAILLVSGSVTGLSGRAEGLGHVAMMEKPFQFGELLGLVRALLADTMPLPLPYQLSPGPNDINDAPTIG